NRLLSYLWRRYYPPCALVDSVRPCSMRRKTGIRTFYCFSSVVILWCVSLVRWVRLGICRPWIDRGGILINGTNIAQRGQKLNERRSGFCYGDRKRWTFSRQSFGRENSRFFKGIIQIFLIIRQDNTIRF